MLPILLDAFRETLFMVLLSSVISLLLGIPLSLLLILTKKHSSSFMRSLHHLLKLLVLLPNFIPYLVILIAIIPLSKWLLGNQGPQVIVAILPLCVAATALFVQVFYQTLKTLSDDLWETGTILGASRWQTALKILLPEAFPAIIAALTKVLVALLGFSTVAGVFGCGGLGQLAMEKGYYSFEPLYLLLIILLLSSLTKIMQLSGHHLARYLQKC